MMDTKEKEMLIHIINAMDKAENISNEIKRVCPPQQCLRFSIDKDKQPSIFDNKLGGKPYWDLALSYPTDEKGKPMAMVFQVNFEQCPHLEPLPAKGILQFFISSDEDIICEGYGCDYDNQWTAPATFPVTLSDDGNTLTIGAYKAGEEFGYGNYRPSVFLNDYQLKACATSNIVLTRKQ